MNYILRLSGLLIYLHASSLCISSQVLVPNDVSKKICRKGGVIFDSAYKISFFLPSNAEFRCTPNISDIVDAENLLFEKYDSAMQSDHRILGYSGTKNVKKTFKNYARQYLGYSAINGQKIILIQLLDFRIPKRQISGLYKNWKSKFVQGSGRFFELHTEILIVNLTHRQVSSF